MKLRERVALWLTGHRDFGCICGVTHAEFNMPPSPYMSVIRQGSETPLGRVDEIVVNGIHLSGAYMAMLTEPDPSRLFSCRRDGDTILVHTWAGVVLREMAE